MHCIRSTKQREGYAALQEKVNTSLAEIKRVFKPHVIEATKLNQATETSLVLEEYVKSIKLIVEAYSIGQPKAATADKIVALMLDDHGDDLLQYLGSVEDFTQKYLEVHNIPSMPSTSFCYSACPQNLQELA